MKKLILTEGQETPSRIFIKPGAILWGEDRTIYVVSFGDRVPSSLGWAKNVRREGNDIYADIVFVNGLDPDNYDFFVYCNQIVADVDDPDVVTEAHLMQVFAERKRR